MEEIPLARPLIPEEAIEAVATVLRSGWTGPGHHVCAFEAEFATAIGAQRAVAVSSGTAALHTAVCLLDLPPGSEVITTPITFVATNQVLLYERCVPVFADVQRGSGNIDPASVRALIGPATRAIMLVHLGGMPCDLDEIYDIAAQHGLAVIEDCAHACGAWYRGRPVGSHQGTQAFSFNSVKNLPLVDGGAVCVHSEVDETRARRLRWSGIDRETYARTSALSYEWEYDVVETGFKYAMSDMNAALGRAQLPMLAANNARRAEIASRYREGLRELRSVRIDPLPYDRVSSWCLFAVQTDDRDALLTALRESGIHTGVHYKRNDLYPMFEQSDVPNAEWYWTHTLSLPMHLELTDHDVDRVIEAVRKAAFDIAGG